MAHRSLLNGSESPSHGSRKRRCECKHRRSSDVYRPESGHDHPRSNSADDYRSSRDEHGRSSRKGYSNKHKTSSGRRRREPTRRSSRSRYSPHHGGSYNYPMRSEVEHGHRNDFEQNMATPDGRMGSRAFEDMDKMEIANAQMQRAARAKRKALRKLEMESRRGMIGAGGMSAMEGMGRRRNRIDPHRRLRFSGVNQVWY